VKTGDHDELYKILHWCVTHGFRCWAAPAAAQSYDGPWVEVEAFSAMADFGGEAGDGQRNLPNLGTNCVHPFKVTGFGAGIQVNVSKISASGPVSNLTKLEDFPGTYTRPGVKSLLLPVAAAHR
jgi:hypothetical protein